MNKEQEYQGYGFTIQNYVFFCEDSILQIYSNDEEIADPIKLNAVSAKCFSKYFAKIAEALEKEDK